MKNCGIWGKNRGESLALLLGAAAYLPSNPNQEQCNSLPGLGWSGKPALLPGAADVI